MFSADDGQVAIACGCNWEALAKADAAAAEAEDAGIWTPHPDPWLRSLVEEHSARLGAALLRLQDAFASVLTGVPIGRLAKAQPWMRFNDASFRAAVAHLESLPPARYSLTDWLLLVDLLLAQVLPPDAIAADADAMATRATLLGHLQAVMPMHQPVTVAQLGHVTALLPTAFARVSPRLLNPVERATLEYAAARAAVNISDLADGARAGMKRPVIEHGQAVVLGQREGTTQKLAQRIGDLFGNLNRDARRIAVTEIGECATQGYVDAHPPGTRLRRVEAYAGACAWCRQINDRVMTVVAAAKPDKDSETEIWAGKDNLGRSASPKKRLNGKLVERTADEMWTIAAGLQHPNCRGRWVRDGDTQHSASQEFVGSYKKCSKARKSPTARLKYSPRIKVHRGLYRHAAKANSNAGHPSPT